MKKLFYLAVFSCLPFLTNAQILAGDFYHETTATNKYDIYLRLVRYCDDAPLNSTQDIRVTVPTDFRNITLTRVSIKNVSNYCVAGSVCSPQNNKGTGNGYEEHIYKASIDLTQAPFGGSTWTTACDLWFAFQGGTRASTITTFNGSGGFYTSSKIDKCQAASNKSPRFYGSQARSICNIQPSNISGKNVDADGDSLSYELIETPIHQSASVTYATSNLCGKKFSGTMPLSPFLSNACSPHVPKPTLDPPQGFYFSQVDATMIFTPNEGSEKSVVTYKVYEWRKDVNGIYKQIGESYKEVFFFVEDCLTNSPPKFTSKKVYNVIPDYTISFDIIVKDDPVIPPVPTTPPPADTVYLSWDTGISAATFTVVDTSRLPIGKFSWTTKCSDASNTPYSFLVTGNDSSCPVPGVGIQTINVNVLTNVKGILGADRIFCGDSVVPFTLAPDVVGGIFKWSDNSTGRSLMIDKPGVYWLEVSSPTCSFVSRDTIIVDTASVITTNKFNRVGECLPFSTTVGNNYNYATFKWNTGPTTPIITVDTFGYYEVTISSQACGTKVQGYTVFGDTLKVDLGQDMITCDTSGIELDGFHDNDKVTYLWSTNETTPSIIPDAFGTYWVQLSHSSCGTLSDTITFTKDTDLAKLGADETLCTPQTKTLKTSAMQYKNSTYLWSTTAISDSIIVSTKGEYILEINNPVCGIFTDTIDINVLLKPAINLGADRKVACRKVSEIVTIPDFGSPTSVNWSTGEQGVNSILLTYPGVYGVTASNICGTSTDSIELIDTAKLTVNLGPDITYCNENFVSISGNFSVFPEEFLWSNNETTSSINIFNGADTTASGTFWLQVKRCEKIARDTVKVTFKYTPVPNIGNHHATDTPFVETLDAGVMGDTYLWNTGDTNRSLEINKLGTYWIKVTNECGVGYDTINLWYISVGKIIELADNINLYPNPTTGNFTLKLDNVKANRLLVSVTSVDGKSIFEKELIDVKGANIEEGISLSDIAKGVYYVTITADNGVYTFKLLLE